MKAKNNESRNKGKLNRHAGIVYTGMNYRNIILEKFLRIIFQ